MTVNEIIDLTDDLAEVPCSPDRETVRFAVSESVSRNGDTASGPVSQLVESLMDLPELPISPVYESKTPPKPVLGFCKAISTNCVNLVWHIGEADPTCTKLKKYELWLWREPYKVWKKVGDIEALTPPMACTLSKMTTGVVTYFAIRAVDVEGRLGPFSLPCNIQQSLRHK